MLPGYKFYPTEEELLSFYIPQQLQEANARNLSLVIPLLDIYELEPWDLPKLSGKLCNTDLEQWFFFVPRQEREIRGGRPNRTTSSGYWKATGSPSYVYSSDNRVIGMKKTMVFYKGKAPTGRKTKWKMNEYRAIQGQEVTSPSVPSIPKLRHEVSLCRVYVVSGSSRAFDRRPLGVGPNKTANSQQEAVTAPRGTQSVDQTKSPETSLSFPEVDHFEEIQQGQGINLVSGPQTEPPTAAWGWEQLINWP